MRTSRIRLCACVLASLAAPAARALNIKANIVVAPPANGIAYQVGEEVPVGIRLRGETVPIDDLELVQVDLSVTGATIPDHDADGSQDVFFAPFGPDGLAGSPSTAFLGSLPTPHTPGPGQLYFWLRTTDDPADLFDLPASDPGREFINFSILLNTPGSAFINVLGPCIGSDGSSSGAFALRAGVNNASDPAFFYQSCDSNPEDNWVQGIPGGPGSGGTMSSPGIMISVVPEPAALGLIAFSALAFLRRHDARTCS